MTTQLDAREVWNAIHWAIGLNVVNLLFTTAALIRGRKAAAKQ